MRLDARAISIVAGDHEPLSPAKREALGITDTLIRVSVGIEGIDDLIADLDRGFAALERNQLSSSMDN